MAGKKRAAKASISDSTTNAATKRAATAAAKKCLQSEKLNKKSAARDDGDKKYHILKLSPIKQDECIALLNAQGVDCGDACDKPHFIGNAFTLKLPLNCQDIADDFVDDYNSDNENTNTGKQSKKPDFVRYHNSPDDENYSYSVVIKLGRSQICGSSRGKEISKKLCYVGLTDSGEAWISICQKPRAHLVHIDGKIIEEPKGVKLFSLHNGTVLSFYGLGYAYRVEIESSVLANKKNALSRMDEVFTEYNKCCICKEPYDVDPDPANGSQNGADPGPRLPIKGKCGHDVCLSCLDRWHLSQCSGKQTRRYVNCPICQDKAFDVQNKVKNHLLCDLIEARRLNSDSDRENNQVARKPVTDDSQQVPLEVTMLRKKFETENAQLRNKICEIEREKTRLKTRNEELEKIALENARLRKRIEELESKPKAAAAGREMDNNDDSDTEDVEVIEVDALPESTPLQQEHDSKSNSQPDTSSKSKEQVGPAAQVDEWACTFCTFLNKKMKRKTCEVCRNKRK